MSLPPGSVRSDRSSSRPTPSRSGSISGPSSNSSSRHVLHQVAYPHQALHQDEHPPTLDQVLDTLATISDLLDSNNPFTAIDLLSHLMDAIATQCESLGLTSENFGDDMQLEGEDPAELRREFWTHLNSQWLKAVTLALKLDDGKQRSKASFSLSSPQNSSTLSSSIPNFSALTNNVTSTSPNSTHPPTSSSVLRSAFNSSNHFANTSTLASSSSSHTSPSSTQPGMLGFGMDAVLTAARQARGSIDPPQLAATQAQQENFMMMMNLMQMEPSGLSSGFSSLPTPSPVASTAATASPIAASSGSAAAAAAALAAAAAASTMASTAASIQAELDAAMGVSTGSSSLPSTLSMHNPHSLVAGFPDAGGMVSAYRLTHPNVAQNLGFPSMALSSFHHLQAAQYAAAAAMQAGSMSGEMDSDPIDMEEDAHAEASRGAPKSIDWKALQDSVVGWSDVLEWYGLVDYENGFWETDILDLISVGVKKAEMASVRLNA